MSPEHIQSREQLIEALKEAALLEHGVTCMYLYVAFSLKKNPSESGVTPAQLEQLRSWQSILFLISRQEMEHLGLVCNLLTAIGGAPIFQRPAFPIQITDNHPEHRIRLIPFGRPALETLLAVEQAHEPAIGSGLPAKNPGSVYDLYDRIRNGFRSVAESNPRLFIGPESAQVTNRSLDLPAGWYDMQMNAVTDLDSALAAVNQILEEGTGAPDTTDASHFDRLISILTAFDAIVSEDSTFAPARPVVSNPTVLDDALDAGAGESAPLCPDSEIGQRHSGGEMDEFVISHPIARQAICLFNLAYDTMNLMLTRYYSPGMAEAAEIEGLKRTVFFPLMTMVLRPLGEFITRIPAVESVDAKEATGATAGPSFEFKKRTDLPSQNLSAWIFLHERLSEIAIQSATFAEALEHTDAPWAISIRQRAGFLAENTEAISHNFDRFMQIGSSWLSQVLQQFNTDSG